MSENTHCAGSTKRYNRCMGKEEEFYYNLHNLLDGSKPGKSQNFADTSIHHLNVQEF